MASALANGSMNGSSGIAVPKSQRFSDIPSTIDIPVQDQDDEAVEIDLEELADDPGELCTLFEMEHAARTYWMTVALAYAKQKKVDFAIEMLMRGANAMQSNQREKLSMITCLCWMYLWKSRDAPRVAPEGSSAGEAKTKEYYLQLATQSLNDASRINPAFPPLFLARGVLILLKASLQPPSKTPGAVDTDKMEQVRNALKSFEEAIRVSQGKNMLAVMGKARALFSLGKHAESLAAYQEVLAKMPTLVDPDPRIGIGCCFWQLGFKDDAKLAWERCLEINPENKYANILLGLYHLDLSGHIPANSQDFVRLYKKAIAEYTQKSYKLDRNLPLTCATFAKYFLPRKEFSNVEILATKAINYTDVNAIASDGWYLLARKEHASGDLERANDYYRRADDSRGGSERGYLPAKFGAAQLAVLKNDLGEAKLRLEKMIQQSKNVEAQVLLGTLYAEEAFANHSAPIKEDKTAESKKAITLLDQVRNAWKDPKKNITPDPAVLLNLARLYETENPERSLQCLKEVEQMELDQIPKSEYPPDTEDEAAIRSTIRKLLPPQLLNNVACFYSQEGKHQLATEFFQAALDSCARISQADSEVDTDALLTTISFNLGRSYEHEGLVERAVETYEQLLNRHSDYTDAQVRLTYIKLRKNPNKEGPEAVDKLQKEKGADLEVRALYGWYLGKVNMKRKSGKLEEDPEYRFYKHTLQDYDKHDRYALVAMGNLQLMAAREMRRDTDADRQKRSHAYSRAVEFFEKVLSLDPKNAYAAQGVGIALAEDKKDFKNALQIFLKVRETLQDPHVFVNLGHVYCEVKQYSKAIENYEIALSKEGKANDPVILSCLGRTWLHKGRAEKNFDAYKTALEYAQKALKVSPEQPHFKFNVAFVQIQLASTIVAQRESERNSFQLEEAIEGLEAAIKALDEIAAAPNPPYPKHDIESRANMARNTQRNHLQKALAAQKEYEAKNKEKQAAALAQRQEAIRKKEELRKKEEEAERERQDKIRRERETIAARDRELAAQRAEEEKQRMEMEMTTDSETGEKVKKKKRPAPGSSQREGRGDREGSARPRKGRATKKKGGSRRDRGGDDGESDGGDAGARGERPKKKARLSSRKEAAASSNKYKSAEIVVDSDDSEGDYGAGGEQEEDALDRAERALAMRSGTRSKSLAGSDDEDDEDQGGRSRRRRSRRDSSGTDGGDNADRMDVDDERERGTGEGDYRAGAGGGGGGDDDDEDEDETVTRRAQAKRGARRGRVVESDDEDEDEEAVGGGGGEPQEKADTSMVDAPDDDE